MKKKFFVLALALCCLLALAGCCSHEWAEADCENPKTCSLCEKTEGEALGHTWTDATCTEAQTCEVCGETDGKPLGHSWADATCFTPKTCEVCAVTEGEPMEHVWLDATTEAPQTCENCGETQGERIITDPRFTTGNCSMLFGEWDWDTVVNGEDLGLGDYFDEFACIVHYSFSNDGTVNSTVSVKDEAAFRQAMKSFTMTLMYEQFAALGYDKAATDAAIEEAYGMTMEQLMDQTLEEMDLEEIFAESATEGVYYVEGNTLYMSESWDGSFTTYTISTKDGTIILSDGEVYDEIILVPVAE